MPLETLRLTAESQRCDHAAVRWRWGGEDFILPGAYLVDSVEHYYTSVEKTRCRPQEARLTKAVAKVTSLNPVLECA